MALSIVYCLLLINDHPTVTTVVLTHCHHPQIVQQRINDHPTVTTVVLIHCHHPQIVQQRIKLNISTLTTYFLSRSHWDHPYNNVRHQIASTLATLLSMDIPLLGAKGWKSEQESQVDLREKIRDFVCWNSLNVNMYVL